MRSATWTSFAQPRLGAGAAALALLLTGCAGSATTSIESTSSVTIDRAAQTTSSALRPLADQVLPDAPPGFAAEGDSPGRMDLDEAAKLDGATNARDTFARLGYSDGYQSRWQNADGTSLNITLYRFSDPGGAEEYTRLSLAMGDAPKDARFEVPGVPDGVGLRVPHPKQGGVTDVVVGVVGPYAFRVVAYQPSGGEPEDLVKALAVQQFNRLKSPAHP